MVVLASAGSPHPPDGDGRLLVVQRLDDVLVQLVGGEDGGVAQPRLVEHPPRLLGEPGEVAGVEPDPRQPVAVAGQLLPHRDGVAHPFQRVVGVHEEHRVGRHGPRVGPEGVQLSVEEHHPAVGVGALHRDAVQLRREDVGGPGHASDVGGAGGGERAVEPLGAAQPEVHHRRASRGGHDAGRLGGDEGLEVDDGEQRRLEQHAGDDGPPDPEQGFVREDHRPLGDGVHVHVEPLGREPVEEGGLEERLPVRAQLGGHGELVEVGEERERRPVDLRGAHELSGMVLTPAGAM